MGKVNNSGCSKHPNNTGVNKYSHFFSKKNLNNGQVSILISQFHKISDIKNIKGGVFLLNNIKFLN